MATAAPLGISCIVIIIGPPCEKTLELSQLQYDGPFLEGDSSSSSLIAGLSKPVLC
jgi:hypothetical protein